MPRLSIALLCFILFSTRSSAQSKEISFLIDTTISVMRANSVNAAKADWNKIRATAFQMAKGMDNPYQLGPVMRYLFQSVDDFHGSFFYKDSTFHWQKHQPNVSDSIMNEWKKGPKIKTRMLKGHIAYLRVPSILAGSIEEFSSKAQGLNDSLCQLLSQSPKGLILDLRLNGGGAMQPMILGLQNLLPAGKVGEFHTKKKEDWILKDNSFIVGTETLAKIVPRCARNARTLPVVILVGSQTGSSGEFLLMTFKPRPKTVLLGATTAGYITVNTGFPLNDTAFLNLAIGFGADKTGKIYKQAIRPDVYVSGPDSFNDIDNDVKVAAAMKWLKEH